jgi:hypothetical protein
MTRKSSGDTNFGIQARDVNADVLAVGTNAKAVKNFGQIDPMELEGLLKEFRGLITEAGLPSKTREVIEKHLIDVETEAKKIDPDQKKLKEQFGKLQSVIKTASDFVSHVETLLTPLHQIASLGRTFVIGLLRSSTVFRGSRRFLEQGTRRGGLNYNQRWEWWLR